MNIPHCNIKIVHDFISMQNPTDVMQKKTLRNDKFIPQLEKGEAWNFSDIIKLNISKLFSAIE